LVVGRGGLGGGPGPPPTARVVRRVGYDGAPDEELPHSLDLYRRVSLYLSHHGVSTCTDADPHCAVCPLLHDCPTGQSTR
jgi:endonuclease III